ncbi:hypothetical protein [Elizabethkingia anophelis]|uniref:hypothetical protein n=1 Tax=Elizabethkingia anophelis TaxID=1117645 RepID=UPI00301C9C1A
MSYITSHTLSYSLLLVIAFNLSSITKLIFFIRNHNSIKGWSWYIFYEIIIIVLTIYLYKYAEGSNMISIQGFIFLCHSGILQSLSTDLRNHEDVNWKKPARIGTLSILFSVVLIAHTMFDFIPAKIITTSIFITISITTVLVASELKKLNQHYKSIKILRRELS